MNLTNENDIEYVVKIDGRTISTSSSQILAEATLNSLDEESKKRAVIVPVTKGGKQFLLG